MITIRATKAAPAEQVPGSQYRFKPAAPTKTPFVLGALMMGVAFYLRGIFPSWGSIVPGEAEPKPEEEDGGLAPADRESDVAELPGQRELDQNPTGTVGPQGPLGSGSGLIQLQPPATFIRIDSPEVPTLEAESDITPRIRVTPSPADPRSVNDNDPPVADPELPGDPDEDDPDDDNPDDDDPGDDEDPDDDDDPGDDEDDDDEDGDGGDRDGDDPGGERPGEGDDDPVEPVDPVEDDDEDDDDEEVDDEEDEDDDETGPQNRAPVVAGSVQLNDVFGCGAVLIALSDLLRNVSDPDGDVLAITGLTVSSGTLVQQGDSWLYDPDGIGPVTFTYQVTDGVHSVTRTAHLDVFKARPIEGTDGDDILVATDCGEEIDGAGGCDLIDAGGGADTIIGGSGDDHIVAGGGNDIVHAGAGDDIVFGGSGNDQISGGDGRDRLFGEDGDDVLSGDGCDDLLDGGAGSDLLFGGSGNDGLEGGDGDDRMQGGSGRDTISGSAGDDAGFGGSGRDALSGGEGRDLLSGGADTDTVEGDAGDDTVLGDPDRADDDYDGGEGRDKIDYSAATEAIEADLAVGVVTGAEIGTDTISAFEIFSAGQGDDSVQGSDEDETIEGNAGDDVIHDGAGSDCIDGGAGDDVVLAAADGDDDHFAGGEGVDKISFAASTSAVQIDLVKKTATGIEIGTDTIRGFEKIEGGSGDDLFIAAGKEVELTGGKGRDVFDFSAAAGESMASQVVHEILDLMVDDRIRLSRYNIFKEVVDTLEDRFEDAYGNRLDEDDMPIRIRHEQTDNARATYVEADLDRNDSYELSIRLEGHHVLFVVDNS